MPPKRQLTENDRRRCRVLSADGGFSATEISRRLGFSYRQVRYALDQEDATPRFSARGRRATLKDEQSQALVSFVTASKKNRQMTYWELAAQSLVILGLAVGYYCIRSTLRRLGYQRYVARKKPHIDEQKRQERKRWAEEHLHWTVEQWLRLLWTSETWITGGPHGEQFVTRQTHETYLDDCLIERWQQKEGWMFLGCFSGIPISGSLKGPGIFWEKDWGTISEQSYRDHAAPVIHSWIQMAKNEYPDKGLVLMQDGAAAYSARGTCEDLTEAGRGVELIHWPAFSPDLDPMEKVWCWMKDYVEDHYGHIEKPSYDMLRSWFLEAWDKVDDSRIYALLASMPQRCRDVIDADGGAIKW